MKRNLALIVSVLMALIMVFALASCGGNNDNGGDTHVHKYGENWVNDASAHWHESSCTEHEKLQANYAPHSFGDDGKCTVCGFCNHLLDNNWSSDESSHWHETNCDEHKGTKPDVASHTFEGAKCTVCGYCKHSYKTEWSTDATNHWYDADCGCADLAAKDFGAHVDEVVDGKCDVCEYVMCTEHTDADTNGACDICGVVTDKALNTISKLDVEAVAKMNSFVVDYYKRTVNGGYEALTDIVASVKYYDNYAVYHTVDGETFYCSTYGDEGTLFVIRIATYGEGEYAETEIIRDTNVTEYPTGTTVVFIDLDYEVTATSAEELISKLYALENKVGQVLAYDEETGMVSFSFAYLNEYEDDYAGTVSNVFVISVEFALDEETNGVKNANVKIDKYETADVTLDTEADTYTVAEGAEKLQEVVYGITQTFGEAFDSTNEPNPYPAEGNVITEDFTLVTKDDEGNVTGEFSSDDDVLTIIVGEGATLYFDDATAAALGYSTIEITTSDFFLDASYYDKQIYVNAYVDGEYLLTVMVEGIEVTITVKVEYAPTTEFEADAETIETFVGTDAIVGAIVGYGQNPYSTIAVVEGNADNIIFAEDGRSWAVSATEAGTYVIELTSVSNPELKDRVTIIFVDAPSIADLLNGTYKGETDMNRFDITAVFTSVDETTGTVILTMKGTIYEFGEEGMTSTEVDVSGTYTYVYNADTGFFALTLTEGNGVEEYFEYLAIEDYQVVAQAKNDFPCTLEKQVEEEDDDDELTATTSPFQVTITDTYSWIDEFTFVAGEAGNYTFHFTDTLGFWSANSRNPEVDYQMSSANSFTLTLSAGQKVVLTVSAPLKGTYEVTFTFEAADAPEEPTVEPGLAGNYIASGNFSFDVVVTEDTISFQRPMNAPTTWTYTVVDGVVTLYANGAEITNALVGYIEIDTTNNVFSVLGVDGWEYELTKQASTGGDEGDDEGGESTGIEGTYTGTSIYGTTIDVIIEATTVTFGFYNPRLGGYVTDVYEYTIADGAMTLTRDGEAVNAMMAAITLTDGVPTAATYNGTPYTLTKNGATGGDEEEPTGNELVIGENEVPVTGDNAQMTEVTFTATEAGEYTFTAGEGVVIEHTQGYTLENESVSFTLEAGQTITLSVNNMYYTAGTGIVTVAFEGNAGEETSNTLVIGNNTIDFTADDMALGAKEYTFYALVNGQYTFASNDVGARVYENGMMLGMGSVHLEAGKTYTVVVFAMAEGTYTLNITAVEDQIGGGEDEEETGTEANPTVLDEIPETLVITSDALNMQYYLFTATQTGTITFTWPAVDSWFNIFEMNGNMTTQNNTSGYNTESFSFAVEAGKTYRVGLSTWAATGDITLTISFTEGEVGGGDEPAGNVLVEGENTIVIGEDQVMDGVDYPYVAPVTGTYTITSNDLMGIFIDADGVQIGRGQVTLEEGQEVTIKLVSLSDAGTFTATLTIVADGGSDEGDDEPTEGTLDNPIVWDEIPENVTIDSDTMNFTYFQFTATESGALIITFPSGESYTALYAVYGGEIDYETSQTSNMRDTATFAIEEGVTYILGVATFWTPGEFTLPLEIGELTDDGSQERPFKGELNTDYTANFQGGYTGIYYVFTAPANGYMTITSTYAGTPWLQIGTNVDNLTNNIIGMDPETYESIYSNTVTAYVFANQTVYVAVGDFDFEAGDVPFKVTFEAFESESCEPFVGTWTGEVENWGDITTYTVTINADGAGSVSEDYGWSTSEYTITFILVDGENISISAEDEYGNPANYTFVYDEEAGTLTGTGDLNGAVFTK